MTNVGVECASDKQILINNRGSGTAHVRRSIADCRLLIGAAVTWPGQAGRKVFAKLNGQSTDRLMQRLGAALPPPTTTATTSSCSYPAVFINYDREARRQLRGSGFIGKTCKRFGPGRRSQVNDSNLSHKRRHQPRLSQLGRLVDVVATAVACS